MQKKLEAIRSLLSSVLPSPQRGRRMEEKGDKE